jgi:formylglycine-generating enzyme required for sulfatase activity/TolB-like protein
MKRAILLLTLFLAAALLPASLFAQKKDSLAIFAFTGGNVSDGEAIASSLTRQSALRNAFNKTTLINRNTIAAMNFEQRFQRNSGLTDADTIFELGKQLNASHVIAGYITRLGDRNLVIVSIMDVESLQQIAGDYRAYRTIEEIDALIPDMARKLAGAVPRNTSALPGLSVPPFNISSGVNQSEAMALAQILSCDLANSGKYAVLPRTDSIEKIMEEQKRQRSGVTDQERIKRLGVGRNAQYVLSGSVQRLGNLNKFAVDILDILDGSFIDGYEEQYTSLSQGFELIPKLAMQAAGGGSTGGATPANFVRVEGGTFQMGGTAYDNEKPIHSVTVKSFSIGKYEVTQKEWFEIMGTNPSNFKGDNLPVESVSWLEAVEYCNRRSVKEGLTPAYRGSGDNITCDWNANGYRLPTEAEWEYAARGGNRDPMAYEYSGSNSVDTVAWYDGNSGKRTHEVGTKAPNSLGLYDMSGNVWEWCWDRYGSYSSGSQTDPRGASSGSNRVDRGGSWLNSAQYVRSAGRSHSTPSIRGDGLGFRVLRPAQ